VKYAKEVILQRFDMAFDTLEAGTKTIERTVSWANASGQDTFLGWFARRMERSLGMSRHLLNY
jgi:hypothetical protein